ncbi:molybdopterin-dependent oxidoreductase [bacterium]|nr:molybdopterin-dependent oxidoreductase [bacterium]MBU1650691.1 molybdopterin-dependent oxidoreductase [bacterium]
MPEITINDITFEVPEGTNLIQAARKVGIDIPHFCYHPGLSVVGSCRMCQVELEQGDRKWIDLACSNSARDGLIVRTNTPEIKERVKATLEFLLMNHPTDCPICDDAGECKLQNYYMLHGLYDNRLTVDKWHKPKLHPVGPTVVLDSERCVLCSRCVRFCDEIWGERQLGIFGHGSNEVLINYPDKDLNNPYAGNVVDLCPVGALLDRDFRHKRRVWYLKSAQSICPQCSRGCNIYVHFDEDHDYKGEGRRVQRIKPRVNMAVNRWWICDRGRYGYHFIDAEERATDPMVNGEAVDWDMALARATELIKSKIKKPGPNSVAFLMAPIASNEDAYRALKLFRDTLKFANIGYDIPVSETLEKDQVLMTDDPYPNRRGFKDLGFGSVVNPFEAGEIVDEIKAGKIKGLVVSGTDLEGLVGENVEALTSKLEWLIVVSHDQNRLWQKATVALPMATYVEREGTFTNIKGTVQKFEKAIEPIGQAMPQWEIWQNLAKRFNTRWLYEDTKAVYDAMAQGKPEYETLNWQGTFGITHGMYPDNW